MLALPWARRKQEWQNVGGNGLVVFILLAGKLHNSKLNVFCTAKLACWDFLQKPSEVAFIYFEHGSSNQNKICAILCVTHGKEFGDVPITVPKEYAFVAKVWGYPQPIVRATLIEMHSSSGFMVISKFSWHMFWHTKDIHGGKQSWWIEASAVKACLLPPLGMFSMEFLA